VFRPSGVCPASCGSGRLRARSLESLCECLTLSAGGCRVRDWSEGRLDADSSGECSGDPGGSDCAAPCLSEELPRLARLVARLVARLARSSP